MQLQTTIIRIHFFEFRFYIVRSFKSDNYYGRAQRIPFFLSLERKNILQSQATTKQRVSSFFSLEERQLQQILTTHKGIYWNENKQKKDNYTHGNNQSFSLSHKKNLSEKEKKLKFKITFIHESLSIKIAIYSFFQIFFLKNILIFFKAFFIRENFSTSRKFIQKISHIFDIVKVSPNE